MEANNKEDEQFIAFWTDHKDTLNPHRTEWEIYHEGACLAGSIDMVFQDKNGKFHIYDWKRTKKIDPDGNFGKFGRGLARDVPDCNYLHYALQLNIYKYILEDKYGLEIEDLYLVRMHPDADEYEKIKLPDLSRLVGSIIERESQGSNCLKEISLE